MRRWKVTIGCLLSILVLAESGRIFIEMKRARELSQKNANLVRLNNAVFGSGLKKETAAISQYICQHSSIPGSNDLCNEWPEYERIIRAVSHTMGYPSQVLSCVYMIESKFKKGPTNKRGVCSHKGACGLAQFMPAAAQDMQRAMKNSPEFQKSWAKFRGLVGGETSTKDFTAAAMRGSGDKVDVQLFATALYFRHHYAALEKTWAGLIESDPTKLVDYYHFLVIGYNAGPKVAERFLARFKKEDKGAYKKIPRETRRYVRDMDDCMLNQGLTLTAR